MGQPIRRGNCEEAIKGFKEACQIYINSKEYKSIRECFERLKAFKVKR